ncbi:MAG: histidinol phosphate phosphatase, partial [Lachnospiraceae bacterium]|nr:histidinol phosphate phosphatase [Lachnospiraceae bacterium]
MPITADYHLHSSFSGDSDTPMEEMIQKGIALGL